MPARTARKNDGAEPKAPPVIEANGSVTATDARAILGRLLDRAGFGGERFRITERGEVKAAIVGAEDLAFLEQHRPSKVA